MDNGTILLTVMGILFLIAVPFFLVRVLIGAFVAMWSWAPVIILIVAAFMVIVIYFPN